MVCEYACGVGGGRGREGAREGEGGREGGREGREGGKADVIYIQELLRQRMVCCKSCGTNPHPLSSHVPSVAQTGSHQSPVQRSGEEKGVDYKQEPIIIPARSHTRKGTELIPASSIPGPARQPYEVERCVGALISAEVALPNTSSQWATHKSAKLEHHTSTPLKTLMLLVCSAVQVNAASFPARQTPGNKARFPGWTDKASSPVGQVPRNKASFPAGQTAQE